MVLIIASLISILILAFIFGACIFGCAGTLFFLEGWLYLSVFFVSTSIITAIFLVKNPKLVENRIKPQEARPIQIIGQSIAGILFIVGMLCVSGFDVRFHWTVIPLWLTIISDFMIIVGFFIVDQVFKVNTFASKAVEVMAEQTVISTGMYAYVRHPMYLGAAIIILFTPLALDCLWAMISALLLCIYIGIRLLDEEKLLMKELNGYQEYCQKVKYHLIPYIW